MWLILLITTDHYCNGHWENQSPALHHSSWAPLWATVEFSQAWLFIIHKHYRAEFIHASHSCLLLLLLLLILQTQVSVVTPPAHTIVIMNQPSTLLSSCSFYISKYFPISLYWIKTWLVPKYVASTAALWMVSCQTSHSPCFSGLRNAFLGLKYNILTSVSVQSWVSCCWLYYSSCDLQMDL